MSVFLAAFLKPFVFFILAACIIYPIKKAVEKYLPEGKLKRLLLFHWD